MASRLAVSKLQMVRPNNLFNLSEQRSISVTVNNKRLDSSITLLYLWEIKVQILKIKQFKVHLTKKREFSFLSLLCFRFWRNALSCGSPIGCFETVDGQAK